MRMLPRILCSLVCIAAVFSACFLAHAADAPAAGKNVVLWISIDGCRGDYVDRGVTPFLQSLMDHGQYTKKLTPVFPSLTFPSHICEATGVRPGVNGIVSNTWYDTTTHQKYNMPGDPRLLEAEPIWLTATRQGVRTAVLDWPLSQGEEQLGENSPHAAYSNPRYDPDPTDLERMQKLVDVYRADFEKSPATEPLRLLMGYGHAIDSAGHKYGPDAEQTTNAVHATDDVLRRIVGQVAEIFKQHMHPETGDALYVLITTDHGMAPVKTFVNLHHLMGGSEVPETVIGLTSGSIANIYLSNVPTEHHEEVKKSILDPLKAGPYLQAWLREDLPAKWSYANATRTGDIVVSLAPGYDFTSKDVTAPTPAESLGGMKGMHGYDPEQDPLMQGFAVLCRIGATEPGKDIGPIETPRFHPTVAKLLGIQPAAGATAPPIANAP